MKKILTILIGMIGFALFGQSTYMFAKAELAQHLLESTWQQSVAKHEAMPPWPWADTAPIARLEFVNQQQTNIVLAGSSGRTLAFAPGHLSGSALPGEIGHMIISAHRDTHFDVLQQVQMNDPINVVSLDGVLQRYKIVSLSVIDSRTDPLILEPENNLLTLITCYPFDALEAGSPFRYRVDAELIR